MSLVWNRAPYSENRLIVLLALADWANDEGQSWPCIERLAKKARVDRRSAQRILRKLEIDGFIQTELNRGRGNQNRYTINLEKLKGGTVSPIEEIKGGVENTEKAALRTQKAVAVSPDPLVEPSLE